jgi:beta propeller repeat protein
MRKQCEIEIIIVTILLLSALMVSPVISGLEEEQPILEISATHSCDICLYDLLASAETPICVNSERQMAPAIYADKIVWTDFRNGNLDVYMYDFSLGIEMQVTADANDQSWPAVYGDKIVYIDNRNGNDDIYMYDLSTGIETPICTNPSIQLSPAIYGDIIVWLDYRNGFYTDVYMYDLSTDSETPICLHSDHYQPSFSGGKYVNIYEDKVVWHDWRNGNADVYMYNLSSGVETQITTNTSNQGFPDIYEDKIVWEDNRNSPSPFDPDTETKDIYMYDLSTGVESAVSMDPESIEKSPAIYGDKIVWCKGWDIYMYDLSSGAETPICTGPGYDVFPDIHGYRIVYESPNPLEPYIKLLFVPLNWADTQEEFNSLVRTQSEFFTNAIPLSACPERISITALNVETQNFATFSCTYPTNCGVGSIKPFVDSLGINTAGYDMIVGLTQASPCSPIAGCSNGVDTVWVTTTYDCVTAHEIGHIYGLVDEYCSIPAGSTDCRCNDGDMGNCSDSGGDGATTGDVNWLDTATGCSPAGAPCCDAIWGDCSVVNYGICCSGNENALGGRCIMSYADAPGPRDYCAHCIAWLSTIAELNCHSPEDPASDQVIVLNMHIYPNDTVKEDKIILRRGKPTNYYQKGEDYNLISTDENGKVIWSQKFNLYFDYMGPVVSGVDYSGIRYAYLPFSYKIPYGQQMYELKLYHEDKVIYTKILNFCNKNGICDSTETYLTCPCDCPLNQRDGICIPNSDGVCDPDCAEGVDPDCGVEEAQKIFFSTEEEFITQGPEPADGNPLISDGDLLCSDCTVFARNLELLAAFQTQLDLGLDAADVIDAEARKPMVAFSTELKDPQRRFTAGDLLATNGAVIPNIALLAMFDITSDDLGLDAVHFIGDKDGIVSFLDYVAEKGRAFWNENPNALPELLQQYDIDIWFSTEGTAPTSDAPLFLDGDLLSARDGNIVAGNVVLLPASVPAGIPSEGVDFGLDAVVADRSGNEETICFSTEILYEGEASFSDGDVLLFGNGVVRTNEDVIQCFKPKSNFLGLDALAIVAVEEEEEEVCRPGIKVNKTAWDMNRQAWSKEISADVQNTVTFMSVIVNNGSCGPLYNIKVTDILSDRLEYANYAQVNSEPREPDEVKDKELTWLFEGPLNPNETITIKYNARVVNCGECENAQKVEAVCEMTGAEVYDEDRAKVIVPCLEVRKPDLVITDLGAVGELQNIYYTLKNQGNAAAGPSWTELRINGEHIMKDSVGSLAPGALINRTFDYTPDCPAGEEVEITVCADIGLQIDESDEDNNCNSDVWTCTALPTKLDIYFADAKESPGSVYHYDTSTEIEETVYTRPSRNIYSFTFHPEIPEKLYYANANEYKIYRTTQLWSGWTPEEVVYTHNTYVRDIAFAFDGNGRLGLYFSEATGAGGNGKIYKLEDSTASLYYEVKLADVGGSWAGDFAFDYKSNLYLSSGNRVPASIYKVEGKNVKEIYKDEKGSISGFTYKDGSLYYANWGSRIYQLDLSTGKRTAIYSNPEHTWLSDVGFG